MRDAYLRHLGLSASAASRPPELSLLRDLQVAHMIAVPFENLDVFHRRGVNTDVSTSLRKIVERRRGGWCFELNGAFGWLLRELGFEAVYVSCRVRGDDDWGPELDHCALLVTIDEQPWFVDVGFGDSCMVPVPLRAGDHAGVPFPIRIRADPHEPGVVFAQLDPKHGWADRLCIDPEPRSMEEFDGRSELLQSEPGLPWTTYPFATRATAADGSRVILRPAVHRTRSGAGPFVDAPIGPGDWDRVLADLFAIDEG